MPTICLTADEVQQITGRVRHKSQVRWLQQQGIVVRTRADGSPVVSRAHFEQQMGVTGTDPRGRRAEPDFSIFGK